MSKPGSYKTLSDEKKIEIPIENVWEQCHAIPLGNKECYMLSVFMGINSAQFIYHSFWSPKTCKFTFPPLGTLYGRSAKQFSNLW